MKQEVAPEHDAAARVFARSEGLTALVRNLATEAAADSNESISVDIQLPVGSKLLNFKRKSSDLLSQVLQRMRISCTKALKDQHAKTEAVPKRARVQTGSDTAHASSPSIDFLTGAGDSIPEDISLELALGQATKIRIDEKEYTLIVDPPVCTCLEIATEVWVGFPVVPNLTVVGAPETEFHYEYRIVSEDGNNVLESFSSGSPVYVPLESQCGKFLEIRCFHPEFPQFYLGVSSVERISHPPHTEGKVARLASPLPALVDTNTIRVSTFNILAQPYVRTPLAMDAYYTHLHKCWHITEWNRRCPLILREMMDTNSDIFCLQEVAAGAHAQLIERAIAADDFDWNYFGKASQANNGNPIGVCISLRKSKFEVVSSTKLELGSSPDSLLFSELSEEEGSQISDRFGDLFFSDVLKGINTIAGVIHARTKKSNRDFLIANTHLFFHPFGGHIRVLQGLCLMRALARMRTALVEANGGQPVGVIVCGDFNSRPDSGSFHVMHTGQIHPEHEDWQYGKAFRFERYQAKPVDAAGEEDKSEEVALNLAADADTSLPPVQGIHAKHTLNISHVPSHISELTHATASFRSTLDYVFFTADTFSPVEGPGTGSSLPELTHAEIDAMGGLPYAHYGSDHVLVCGDLRFNM